MITRKCAIGVASQSWVAWTQPTLSANGTMGGSSFAVEPSSFTSGYDAWHAFDNGTTPFKVYGTSAYIKWYNPNQIKVTSVAVTNGTMSPSVTTPKTITIYGSDDGTNWTSLASYTNTNVTTNATWTITVNATTGYKYHKMGWTATNPSQTRTSNINEIDITATVLA